MLTGLPNPGGPGEALTFPRPPRPRPRPPRIPPAAPRLVTLPPFVAEVFFNGDPLGVTPLVFLAADVGVVVLDAAGDGEAVAVACVAAGDAFLAGDLEGSSLIGALELIESLTELTSFGVAA